MVSLQKFYQSITLQHGRDKEIPWLFWIQTNARQLNSSQKYSSCSQLIKFHIDPFLFFFSMDIEKAGEEM